MGKKSRTRAVTRFEELHSQLSRLRGGWIFRGHSDMRWKLVPKAGREPFQGREKKLFRFWKLRAVEHVALEYVSDWDRLAIAQHHGLATRLLDWTVNPLNAAFFAARMRASGPAVVHAAKFLGKFNESAETKYNSPFECDGISLYRPRGVVRQGGLFTVHGPPEQTLEGFPSGAVKQERIEIAESYRDRLLSDLAFFGVSSASLFPDLDGLSSFLNWSIEAGESLD